MTANAAAIITMQTSTGYNTAATVIPYIQKVNANMALHTKTIRNNFFLLIM